MRRNSASHRLPHLVTRALVALGLILLVLGPLAATGGAQNRLGQS